MKYQRVAYVCDGHGCDKNCADMPKEEWDKYCCHHTTDESHARNKCRRNRKFTTSKNGEKFEVE